MDSQSLSSQNRTAGCESPGVVSGDGGRTPPKPSAGRNQSLNTAASSSSGGRVTSSFPPNFSGDEPRPLQTDFFRYASLFFAHLGPEEESEQWASYLPENLRPGNIDKYLEETDEPQLFGNNYWWLSQDNAAQEQPSFNHSSDPIRYSTVQLLELREVVAIPENILKINQEIEDECQAVNQIIQCGGIKGANTSLNSMKEAPQTGEKEKHEVGNISVNSTKEAPQTAEKEKREGSCYTANHQMRNVNLSKHRKEVGQLDSGPAEEHPKAKDCHLVYKRSRKKNMVANISENSLQGEPQTGEKQKQEGSISKIKMEKKKLRVLSKERKEKIRIAKKEKRAEKNRKLGVKRLKIQPLLKPKPVSHCRHYLKGRCHEGEKCKFSHDVQPLTKSQPCCHFARQSCMKGDDCPYDHDLSKYPCNKYVSTGFCPRQGNCLFSHKVTPNEDPSPTTSAMKPETKASNPPPASDSIQHHSQKAHFVFGAHNQQADVSTMAEYSRGNVSASKADQEPQGLSLLNSGNSQKDKQLSTSADFIVSGKKTVFGGDPKGPALPSNPPASPESAGVFVFGKNLPPDHNLPASPNSAGVFVFGKNPPPDHDNCNQPSLLSLGNNNKMRFGGGKKGSAAPSNSPTSAFSARIMKNTSGSGLSSWASGSSPVNTNQGTGPVSGSKPFESRVNVHASSAGTTSASADASKNVGTSPKKKPSAVEVWEALYGRDQPTSSSSGPLSTWASGSSPVSGSERVESEVNSASADASSKKQLSGLEVWEALYGRDDQQPTSNTSSSSTKSSFLSTWASGSSPMNWSWTNLGTGPVNESRVNSASADASLNKKQLSAVEAWETIFGKKLL